MMRIALLTSTKPLRATSQEGRTRIENLDRARLQKLADGFDLVIIGSRAADDFFKFMDAALPRRIAERFRTYPRSFFSRFRKGTPQGETRAPDFRDEAWMTILDENGIDFTRGGGTFDWRQIGRFILDKRVTVIETPEDIA